MNDSTTTATATNGQTQAQIDQQQADAANGPKTPVQKAPTPKAPVKAPAPKTAPVAKAPPVKAEAAKKAKPEPVIVSSLISLNFGLMVTLDMTGQEIFKDQNDVLKSQLTSVEIGGATHNLYQPFRAVTAKVKKKNPDAARGLLRNALNQVFGIVADLEANKTNYVGEAEHVERALNGLATGLQTRVQSAIGIDPSLVLIDGSPAEEGQPAGLTLRLSDMLSIETWANTHKSILDVSAGEGEVPNITSQVFINFRIAAANLFVAEELDNGILAIKNFLTAAVEKFSAENDAVVPMLIGLNMNVDALTDRRFIDVLSFTNADGWDLYSRKDLEEAAEAGDMDWVPADPKVAADKLLGGSDMLLVTLAASDAEAEEAGESEEE